MSARTLRPFPKEEAPPGVSRAFLGAYRRAFDADPGATFCAGELDGVTVVVAVGARGAELEKFVANEWGGLIERLAKKERAR